MDILGGPDGLIEFASGAGRRGAADGIAANAFTTTTIAAAVACFTWGMMEKILRGNASILGFCSGVVAGLVVATPAAGFITTTGAVTIGGLAGTVPYFFITKVKARFGYDDALDTFGIHAVGGTLGAFLTGLLATGAVNRNLTAGAGLTNGLAGLVTAGGLWHEQLKAIATTLLLSVLATAVIGIVLKHTIGLRPIPENERQGLDLTEHGEEGYID